MSKPSPYIGRFAPSPTGPLHFGSLLAAVASYLEARQQGGRWLLRIEDIDPPREQAGATRLITDALDRYGFDHDGPVQQQSDSHAAHRAALEQLLHAGHAYYCRCSRKDLADAPRNALGIVYPGHCRERQLAAAPDLAVRLRTDDTLIGFTDALQGRQSASLARESGDFVIWRRDGLVAYQLAVVVDDHRHSVSDIVRGIDLMDSTPRQLWLQRLLGYAEPAYAHIPVATHADGSKLSKLTGAAAIPLDDPGPVLYEALRRLRQSPPEALARSQPGEIWRWAFDHWDIDRLAGVQAIPMT